MGEKYLLASRDKQLVQKVFLQMVDGNLSETRNLVREVHNATLL